MWSFHADFWLMRILNELLGTLFGYRLIPDTRVKRFNEDEAVAFLRAHNKLSYLWDDTIWQMLKRRPEEDIFQAYEDVCYEHECAE